MINKKLIGLVSVVLLLGVAGCEETVDKKDVSLNENNQSLITKNQPIRPLSYSAVRETKLNFMDASNRKSLPTTTYMYCGNTLRAILNTQGFPVNTAIQTSNPQKVDSYANGIVLPQSEPNGTFLPDGFDSASVVDLVLPDGSITPFYTECNLTTTAARMKVGANGLLVLDESYLVPDAARFNPLARKFK